MNYVLYNSNANSHKGEENAREVMKDFLKGDEKFIDVITTSDEDLKKFMEERTSDDVVTLAGGDGTINRFVNRIYGLDIKCTLNYIPAGSGNDFYTDIKTSDKVEPVKINDMIKNLPLVEVNGKSYRFINGVGYGIDGYCCEVADELAKKSEKDINYASIAIKGMLYAYKPTTCTIKVDDNEPLTFKKAWLAPTMKGRYYGGGMKVIPTQDRNVKDKKVGLMVLTGHLRLKALIIFSKIFTGDHVKYKTVHTFTGNKITVSFKSPRALQVDGETIKNVSTYTVYTDR